MNQRKSWYFVFPRMNAGEWVLVSLLLGLGILYVLNGLGVSQEVRNIVVGIFSILAGSMIVVLAALRGRP